jgi:signal transduction histidine kinase
MNVARLMPSGMRWRLTAWVALVMMFSFAVTVFAVYQGTGTQIRRDIDNEIQGDLAEFSQALRAARPPSVAKLEQIANSYATTQPFSATSTLLLAQIPGQPIATNQPELFGLRGSDGETTGEQRAEDRISKRLLSAPTGYTTRPVADVGDLRLLTRRLRVGSLDLRISVGEPLAIVANAQRGVVRTVALAAALALGIALIASLLVGARVSAPLRRMAAVAARVDGGDLHPRIPITGSKGDETRVLAIAFNHMLDRLTTAFAAQHAFVADASHELRTPLTVIRGQLEVLAAQRSPAREDIARVERIVAAEVERMSRLADDLLLLAQAEQAEYLRPVAFEVRPFIDDLWAGVTATAKRRFELGRVADGTLVADPDRLAQALRNLTTNAITHTATETGLVRLEVAETGGERLRFTVTDDGPGIAPEQREHVFDRFYRTDAARSRGAGGAGLGLAIVRAIAESHGGSVAASERRGGGTVMVLELGGFGTAGPPRSPSEVAIRRRRVVT